LKPFRKNVAIAIDGGDIRGVVITQALTALQEERSQPIRRIYA